MNRILIVTLLLMLSAVLAQAAPPTTINFQGQLRSSDGGFLVNGAYAVVFSLYLEPAGGTAVWTETQAVTVTGSFFDTVLGETNALTVLPFDAPYWLGIKVATEPEMTPRLALTSVPYAMNVADNTVVRSLQGLKDDINLVAGNGISIGAVGQDIIIKSSSIGTADDDWQVSGSDMSALPTGNVGIGVSVPVTKLNVNGAIRAGTEVASGQLQATAGTGATASSLSGNINGLGGQLDLKGENGVTTTLIAPDASGQGGHVMIMQSHHDAGIVLDGANGVGSVLSVLGTASTLQLRSDLSGDNSVLFPDSAINPTETSAEAGVASVKASTGGALPLTTSVAALASRTIIAPASGFVMAMSSCEVAIDLFNNTTFTTIGLSENPTTLPDNQDINVFLSQSMGNGLYVVPQSNTALFPVNAGSNTFYLSGSKSNTNSCTVRDIQLTLVFIPTAYGTIQATNAYGRFTMPVRLNEDHDLGFTTIFEPNYDFDPDENRMGFYFDEALSANRQTITPEPQRVQAYLVLFNPSNTSGVAGWECRIAPSAGAVLSSYELEGSFIDANLDPHEFTVGIGLEPIPYHSVVTLGTFQLDVWDMSAEEIVITAGPVERPTIPGLMAWVPWDEPEALIPILPITGRAELAWLDWEEHVGLAAPSPTSEVQGRSVVLSWPNRAPEGGGYHVFRRVGGGLPRQVTADLLYSQNSTVTYRDDVVNGPSGGADNGADDRALRYSYALIVRGQERARSAEVEVDLSTVPVRSTRLLQNVPNPFNPETAIHYEVAERGRVALSIYDITGRRVQVLVDGTREAGAYAPVWNGCDASGRPVASGAYYVRLETLLKTDYLKVMLIK